MVFRVCTLHLYNFIEVFDIDSIISVYLNLLFILFFVCYLTTAIYNDATVVRSLHDKRSKIKGNFCAQKSEEIA